MIKLHKTGRKIPLESGETLMANLLGAGVPVASSCGGEGICGKCKVTIISGQDNLSAVNEVELLLREKNQLKGNERISCQVWVKGNCEIDTSYW